MVENNANWMCSHQSTFKIHVCGSVYTESFIYPPWPIPVVSLVSVSCYNEPATLCSVYIPTRHTGYDRCSTRCSTTLVMESVDLTWR